jgi:ankyrin repeat protein
LTLYLNKYLDNTKLELQQNQHLGQEIWRIAFEIEWQGDLSVLPKKHLPNIQNGLLSVKTRSMYHRLCRIAPEIVNYDIGDDIEHPPCRFINIPLRRLWLDLIDITPNDKLEDYVMYAAHGGHLDWIRHLVNMGAYKPSDYELFDINVMAFAARSGSLELLLYLIEQGCRVDAKTIEHAALTGHLHLIEFLHRDYSRIFTTKVFVAAARCGNLDMVKFCHKHQVPCDDRVLEAAAIEGHAEILEYIHTNGLANDITSCMEIGARKGNLELVKFLHERFNAGAGNAPVRAASRGHLEIVKYMLKHYPEDCRKKLKFRNICGLVRGERSLLPICKYLHEHLEEAFDIPQDAYYKQYANVYMAAYDGFLDVLKFLIEVRGEPINHGAIDRASISGHLDIVKYLHSIPTATCTTFAMDGAASGGKLEVVQFLHENRKEGCTFKAVDIAAEKGHLDVVRYLLENRDEGYSNEALDRAWDDDMLRLLKAYPHKLVEPADVF